MYENRIRHLTEMHEVLDKKIDNMEKNHAHIDEIHVQEWKKQRLHIKDELSKLYRLQYEASMSREDAEWHDDR